MKNNIINDLRKLGKLLVNHDTNSLINSCTLLQDGITNALLEAEIKSGDTLFIHSDVTPVIHAPEFGWITNGLAFLKDCFFKHSRGRRNIDSSYF